MDNFYFVILFAIFCQIGNASKLQLSDSRGAELPLSIFANLSANIPEVSRNLAEYVPFSSRKSYRGAYKIWPTTFNNFLLRMPLPTLKLVKFILHTRKSPKNGEELNPWNPDTIERSSWNSNEKVKILIHGYQQNSKSLNMPIQLLRAYRTANTSANFILVEWGVLAAQPYFESAMYSQNVGRMLAEFLLILKRRGFLHSFASVHIVGSCLGAHLAGAAAYHLKQRAGNYAILGRITGLDPSGPGFYSARNELRLDAQDADYVDIIHTNGGLNFRNGELGIPAAIGYADFFPNGGLSQPICEAEATGVHGEMISACNHLKAADYYKRSIAEEIFRSCRCGSWSAYDTEACTCIGGTYMGEYVQKAGKFYLHVFEYTLFEMFENEGLMGKK